MNSQQFLYCRFQQSFHHCVYISHRYERGAVMGSINIPFSSVQLSHTHIDTLGPQAKPLAERKDGIVVIVGPHDQNNALVSFDNSRKIHNSCQSKT